MGARPGHATLGRGERAPARNSDLVEAITFDMPEDPGGAYFLWQSGQDRVEVYERHAQLGGDPRARQLVETDIIARRREPQQGEPTASTEATKPLARAWTTAWSRSFQPTLPTALSLGASWPSVTSTVRRPRVCCPCGLTVPWPAPALAGAGAAAEAAVGAGPVA